MLLTTFTLSSFAHADSYQILVKRAKNVIVYGFAVGEYQGKTMNMNVRCEVKDQDTCLLNFPTMHQGVKILKSAFLNFDSANSGALIETIGLRAVKIPIVEDSTNSASSSIIKFSMQQMGEHGTHPKLQCGSEHLINSGIVVSQNNIATVEITELNSCEQ